MSQVDELLDSIYAAFIRGDLDEIEALLEPDVEFVNPPDAIEAGVRKGPAEFMVALRALHDAFNYGSVRTVDRERRGDRVLTVVEFEASGKDSGAPFSGRFSHIFELRGGRIASFRWFRGEEAGRQALAGA